MMRFEHTVGPWVLKFGESIYGDGKRLATCAKSKEHKAEVLANARLMQASPNLFDAVLGLLNATDESEHEEARKKAWLAVALALGESEETVRDKFLS